MDFVTIIVALIILIALGLVGAWFVKGYLAEGNTNNGLFGSGRQRRIGVVDTASVDGRRKLLLIQRDGVEHLVMTGGPIDVVIESGIAPQRRQSMGPSPHVEPVTDAGQQSAFGGRARAPAANSQVGR